WTWATSGRAASATIEPSGRSISALLLIQKRSSTRASWRAASSDSGTGCPASLPAPDRRLAADDPGGPADALRAASDREAHRARDVAGIDDVDVDVVVRRGDGLRPPERGLQTGPSRRHGDRDVDRRAGRVDRGRAPARRRAGRQLEVAGALDVVVRPGV